VHATSAHSFAPQGAVSDARLHLQVMATATAVAAEQLQIKTDLMHHALQQATR
jgi:hypothetical protein